MTSIPAITKTALLLVCGLAAGIANAASLNKCIDTAGKVTYSNLPCRGAQETRKVEIDAAPPVPRAPKRVVQKPAPEKAREEKSGNVSLETFAPVRKRKADNGKQCDALSDQLGRVMDKMDAARRQGYTQKQTDGWKRDIKALELKKQQAGCF